MLIPAIDLMGGRIVQLVQGERLAIASDDIAAGIDRFRGHAKIQVIDLDAAKSQGSNEALVARICRELRCRVGGGIRSLPRAGEVLAMGATQVILGSSLFRAGAVDVEFAARLAEAFGTDRLIAAVDARGGRVVVNGWRTQLDLSPVEAVHQLEPYVGEFLYTHVDREGLMQGTDMGAIRAVRDATARRITAAGGITTRAEIDELDSIGVDAVVGMAIYVGKIGSARFY
jgi:phosphoribosylformimino-5-aminoimidazole carboxamide ribotide isomerase